MWTRPLIQTRLNYSTKKDGKGKDAKFLETIRSQLKEMEGAGTYKKERVITSPQSSAIKVSNSHGKHREVINFWYVV
jgi:hypothetical protein